MVTSSRRGAGRLAGALAFAVAMIGLGIMASEAAADGGVRVTGTIEKIVRHEIPSKFAGVPPRPVSRIRLKVERAVDHKGDKVDTFLMERNDFEGPPELVNLYKVGERVEILTTTPNGLHIASIKRAPLN